MGTIRNKFERTPEDIRPYNTTHQIVWLQDVSIQRKCILGVVDLTIVPKRPRLRGVKLNCKQCRLYKIIVNDLFEAPFEYFDPLLEVTPRDIENNQFSLDQLAEQHRQAVAECDPDAGGGEVFIRIPSEASPMIAEGRPFRLTIEFSLENPSGGLHFVIPDESNSLEKPHMFTCRHENCTRLWFPCIDSFSEVCTWKLEFTVHESLTAVSCGDLVDVVEANVAHFKTFHYYVSVPTAAPNIGVAIGAFEIYVDPNMHEITHFCLPGMMNLLRWTSRFLYEMFEFYEESLGTRFPYSCFKTVFVHEAYTEMTSYASMCILSNDLLHTSAIIDQTYITRRFSALSVAEQFYSCFISMQHTSDAWLAKGISNYLCGLYLKKFFGNNEYRHWIHSELQEVIKYEQKHGGIILDPSVISSASGAGIALGSNSNSSSSIRPIHQTGNMITTGEGGFYFYLQSPHTVSPEYLRIYSKKAHLIIRMLEFRIGSQLLLQVLNKQLSLATIHIEQLQQAGSAMAMQQPNQPNSLGPTSTPTTNAGPGVTPTNPMLISTASFTRAVFTVTGKDMTVYMDQWVRQGGHVRFHMSFIFNRKRNTVELELKQEHTHQLGVRKYVGPLTVALQELDGTFKHVLQIEGTHAKADIVCHSKSRRQKKKKIPLCTGEEVDMDLSTMDAESPVLWIRLDPDMTLIRAVDTRQPDFQWQYQMKHERDVTAQIEAIWALEQYPTPQTRIALTDLIENEHVYYKVRCEACHCLAKVANSMVSNWTGPPAMIGIFRKLFGSFSCPQIVRVNEFSNLQHYFLQKTIPVAMATLRNVHGICPADILRFLFDLFKYNDNSRNRLSDNYYRAALIKALGNTVTPVVSLLHTGANITVESLSADTRAIMEEISKCLNLEKVLQCYKYTVTVECLRALRKLQKFGHLPNKIDLFRTYTVYGQFFDVRVAAFEAIVDYTITDGNIDDVEYLMNVIENDPVPLMRHEVCRLLIVALGKDNVDKRKAKSPFHCPQVARRLWLKLNYEASVDSRYRCDLVDLYYTLFGTRRPACGLEDRLQDQMMEDVDHRRKSQITTREGLDEEIPEEVGIDAGPSEAPTSAKVLSCKRESMADSSGELPEAMDASLPTSFEPGMFKKEREDDQVATTSRSEQKGESSSHKKHHHHHSKKKKNKDKKKKHKHRHKHKPVVKTEEA